MSSENGIGRGPGPTVSRGVYGFVIFLASKSFCLLWVLWVLTPQHFIDAHGLDDFFPSKYWALAFPVWLFVFSLFIFIFNLAINEKISSDTNFWENLAGVEKIEKIVF